MANVPVYLRLSGGAENYNPDLSLGGVASQVQSGILVSQTAEVQGQDGLPGLVVVGGWGVAPGVGLLSWNNTTGVLTFTDFDSNVAVAPIGVTGVYTLIGPSMRIIVDVAASPPAANASCTYAFAAKKQNLFDNVSSTERAANHNNYRCLFIKNQGATNLLNLAVTVDSPVEFGEIQLATEYPVVALPTADAEFVEKGAVQKGGTLLIGGRPYANFGDYPDVSHKTSLMFPAYNPIGLSSQESDGATTQLPSVLVDENDSTNVLSGLSWSQSVGFGPVTAGAYVSFWVRRKIDASTSGTALEVEQFKLDIRYGRSF